MKEPDEILLVPLGKPQSIPITNPSLLLQPAFKTASLLVIVQAARHEGVARMKTRIAVKSKPMLILECTILTAT